MTLSPTSITWRGLTIAGSASDYRLLTLEGWEENPDPRMASDERPGHHGRFDAQVWSDERVITAGGRIRSTSARDDLLAALRAAMTPSDGATTEPLLVSNAGLTLTADARLARFRADTSSGWAAGYVPFVCEWRCADPLRYGTVRNAPTGFPTQAGGLEFDLFTNGTTDVGYLDFGSASTSGRVTLSNEGTADSWAQFQVAGPTPPFWITCVETGQRLYFNRALSSGETLLIDSATGIVTLNGGGVDYSGLLTVAEWFPIPKQGSCTVAFLPNGSWMAGQLTVIYRAPWW